MNKAVSVILLFCVSFFSSCSTGDDEKDTTPRLQVDNRYYTLENTKQDLSVPVSSNVDWTASCDASWIKLDQMGGSGDATLVLTVAANTSKDNRSAEVVLKSEGMKDFVFKITQYAPKAVNLTVETGQCTIEKREYSATGFLNPKDRKKYRYKYTLGMDVFLYGNTLASKAGWEMNTNTGVTTITIDKLSEIDRGKATYSIMHMEWFIDVSPGTFTYKGFAVKKSDGKKVYGAQKNTTLSY